MSYHYKKDGSMDMRFASSKAYVAANSSSAGGNSGSSSYSTPSYSTPTPSYTAPALAPSYTAPAPSISHSSYSAPSPSYASENSDTHYKKDGSLDMRYSSSKVAAASAATESPRVSQGTDSGNHYKKDGSLDMRYNSSKEAAAAPKSAAPAESSGLHHKKDGSLDMRYSTSKSADMSENRAAPADEPRHRKDGSLDMRFKTSREAAHENSTDRTSAKQETSLRYKKDGTLDMRFKSSKNAMAKQDAEQYNAYAREEYWENLMREAEIQNMWERQKEQRVTIPRKQEYIPREHLTAIREQLTALTKDDSSTSYLEGAVRIPYNELDFSRTGKKQLGSGAFGEVYLGYWNTYHKNVAVKQLRLDMQPNRKEKRMFEREIAILAQLGKHPNLVAFYGYSPEPLCIIMEYVELGNLHYLLHKCEDRTVELKITDGRIKKNIVIGVVDGMMALHEAGIVHGDLKPQNILIARDYTAKITDFGLANLRGKAASTVQIVQHEQDTIIGGTGPYMAPERLDYGQPNFSCDVYAFGVVLNELTTEEEPYSDQYANFVGHDQFAIARYAQQGNRPRMQGSAGTDLTALIKDCWNGKENRRPSFDRIQQIVRSDRFKLPNGPGLN